MDPRPPCRSGPRHAVLLVAAFVVTVSGGGCRTPTSTPASRPFAMIASRTESGPALLRDGIWTAALPLAPLRRPFADLGLDPADAVLRVQPITDAGPVRNGNRTVWYELDLGDPALPLDPARTALLVQTAVGIPGLRLRSQIQICGAPPGTGAAAIVDTVDLRHWGDPASVVVWFPEGDDHAAAALGRRLRRLRAAAEEITGLAATTPFGVVMVRTDTPTLVVTAPGIWPYRVGDDDLDVMLPVFVHELVETSLHDLIRLREDPANRWISDGIAEWATARALESAGEWCALRRMLARSVYLVRNAGGPFTSRYDLARFNWPTDVRGGDTETIGAGLTLEPAGYAVAHAFWLHLAHDAGAPAVRRFLAEARDLPRADEASLVELLERIAERPVAERVHAAGLVPADRAFRAWMRRADGFCREQIDGDRPVTRTEVESVLGTVFRDGGPAK